MPKWFPNIKDLMIAHLITLWSICTEKNKQKSNSNLHENFFSSKKYLGSHYCRMIFSHLTQDLVYGTDADVAGPRAKTDGRFFLGWQLHLVLAVHWIPPTGVLQPSAGLPIFMEPRP